MSHSNSVPMEEDRFVKITHGQFGRVILLKPIAVKVFLFLTCSATHYNGRFTVRISKARLANSCQIGRNSAITAVRELVDAGLLRILETGSKATGAAVYEIL